MGKHHWPTLVRAFQDDYRKELRSAFVDDWAERDGRGTFTLPADSDLAITLLANSLWSFSTTHFVVESASAVEWLLHHWSYKCVDYKMVLQVECVSREVHARQSVLPDDALIYMWLGAERRYLDELAQELLKVG